MAAQSNLKNMVLCLFGTCLVCSAILAGVYAVTKEPIAATELATKMAAVEQVLPKEDGCVLSGAQKCEVGGQPSEFYTYTRDGELVAVAVKSVVNGFGGPLTLMVGIRADGTVYKTVVVSHNETPGLGAKCETEEKFYSQFEGLNPAEKSLKVKKDGGDIDAITASTITSRAYTKAVENATQALVTLPEFDSKPVAE